MTCISLGLRLRYANAACFIAPDGTSLPSDSGVPHTADPPAEASASSSSAPDPVDSSLDSSVVASRRQRAYRAALGAGADGRSGASQAVRSARRRNVKAAGTGVPHGGQSSSGAADSAAPEARSAGGAKENTWTDSSSEEEGHREANEVKPGSVASAEKHSRRDSFNWDSDGENGSNGEKKGNAQSGVVEVVIVVSEEADADHRVLMWARGKDIVAMLQTFSLIYQGEDRLPDSLINPNILSAGDVRKTYL
jgi:hypothetical protein